MQQALELHRRGRSVAQTEAGRTQAASSEALPQRERAERTRKRGGIENAGEPPCERTHARTQAHIYIHICIYIYIHSHIYIYICMCVYVFLSIYVSTYVYIYTSIYVHTYMQYHNTIPYCTSCTIPSHNKPYCTLHHAIRVSAIR